MILTIIYVVMFIKDLTYLDKIIVGAKAAVEGKLNYKIEEKGRGHLRELAHGINNIKDGLKKSIENEMKSENMKTELITNVSHDLKTPLTSIINYIDLLKREEEVCITMRNISSYELNFDASEITDRFKRGDDARTTEGSGLGLAIAKSIVKLHHGQFKIDIDGDLFKSIIKLKY